MYRVVVITALTSPLSARINSNPKVSCSVAHTTVTIESSVRDGI
jgi:hypothetical protein